MKKFQLLPVFFILIYAALNLSVSSLPASVSADAALLLDPAEMAWLKEHPVLRLAPDPDFKPIEFFDKSGGYQGIAAENIRLLEKKLGIKFQIVRKENWDDVLNAFKSGEIELLGAIVPTPARAEFLLFTEPLFDVPGGIFVQKEKEQQRISLKDLKGMRVSVVSNYTAHDLLRKEHPDIILDVVPSTQAGLQKLSFGMSDAFIENVATASYSLQESALTNIRLAGSTDFKYRWAIGVRKDMQMLQQILNKGLKQISEQERLEINNKWVPLTQPGWRLSRLSIAMIFSGFALLIATAVVVWNRSLSREIEQRKRIETELEKINQELEERVKQEVERSRDKDRLIFQQARDSAMGEMLQNIAHEWRQPLNNIAIYVQNLELMNNDGVLGKEELHEDVRLIMDMIMQMSSTIDDFRSFFRLDKKPYNFSVNEKVSQVVRYVSSRLEHSRIKTEVLVKKDSILHSYPSEYLQVLLNIFNNAIDALMLSDRENREIMVTIDSVDGRSIVKIADNAGGIPEKILSSIFDPYFTTKQVGEGTGLGLYMAKVIIEKNIGGSIRVSNNADGAEFSIEV